MRAIFIDDSGTRKIVELIPGETLMTAALRGEIEWISGACGGSMACGTCHAHVMDRADFLPPPSDDETDLLSGETHANHRSRLLCQIIAGSSDEDIVLTHPECENYV